MHNSDAEVPYACSCCFLEDFDNLNTIIYCDDCDSGVHLKCYGLGPEVLDDDDAKFRCDVCMFLRKRGFFQDLSCYFCKKSGQGMMKRDKKAKMVPKGDGSSGFENGVWYHPFCAMTNPLIQFENLNEMKGIKYIVPIDP